MKFKRILTAVLAVLMLATCMSFTVSAETTTVYVNGTAGTNGDGTQGSPYNTFAAAWNAVKANGGTIIVTGNTPFEAVETTSKTVTIQGSPATVVLDVSSVTSFTRVKGQRGMVKFNNISLNAGDSYFTFEGMGFEFGENVTMGAKALHLRHSVGGAKLGDNVSKIYSGKFGYIVLGWNFVNVAGSENGTATNSSWGNMNFELLGGTANEIRAGFYQANGNNYLSNVNVRVDVAPGSVKYGTNAQGVRGGTTFQYIANNGVTVAPTLDKTPVKQYQIYSAEGGTCEFIYVADSGFGGITAKPGEYKVTTTKKYVVVDNKAIANDGTTEPRKIEYSTLTDAEGGGKLLTLDAGEYNVSYVNDTVTLNFNENKSVGDETAAQVVIDKTNEAANISALVTTPTNDGYRFLGWNTQADGNGSYVDLSNFVIDEQISTYYAIWGSTTLYVNGTASTNGNGEQATPYNNVADAWNAILTTGGEIILLGDTTVTGALTKTNKTVLFTATNAATVLDFGTAGNFTGDNSACTGVVKFDNITVKVDRDSSLDFYGMAYEFGANLTIAGTKKPVLRSGVNGTKFGDNFLIIRNGDFSIVHLGINFTNNGFAPGGVAANAIGNVNFQLLGGTLKLLNVGYTLSNGGNRFKNINLLLDVAPDSIVSNNIEAVDGAYQMIANNGVTTEPVMKNRHGSDLNPGGGTYLIYSAEGGRVDFVYGTGATTATVGTYTITSDKKYAIITNLDTGDAVQQDLTAAGGTTLTLTAGKYSIGYANDPATLNFHFNDGTSDKQSVLIEKTATDISTSVVTPTYAGNRFLGWNTETDGTGTYVDLTNYAFDEAVTDFYAIWDTFVVYVDGNAAVNGVGTEDAPYNNLTDAWNALKDSDDIDNVIFLSGNVELPSGLDNVKSHIIITSKEGEKARLMLAKGATFNSANGNRGIVVFDNIYFQADATESVNFGGMSYAFTGSVVSAGSYKPSLRSAVNMEKFGDNRISIAGGDFDQIVLGNNYSQNDVNNGNINFELLGGSVRSVNVGYSIKQSGQPTGHWSNVLRNVNVRLDVEPGSISSIGVESMSGTYQFIANNGIKTIPGMATRSGAELVPAERKYLLYSEEGGIVDFIYESDAAAVVGKFMAYTDRQTVVVINRDTLEVTEFPAVAGAAELTLAPGVYDISYTGEVVVPPVPSNPVDTVGAVVSILFNKFTVEFDTDGGSAVASQKVMIGGKVTKPAIDPVKAGYKFDGWYADKEFAKKFSFLNTQISANTTIYAKWTADETQSIMLTIDSTEAIVFGKKVTNDVAPIIRNDRTMLPARFVAENLGAKVEWFEGERKVVITSADKNTIITLFIDSATAYINGVAYTLDAPAFIENSRTYTPVRFIAEALGADVEWDAETRVVTIIK